MADEPSTSANPLRDAANCLRSVMLLRAPHLIQDRLYHQQIYESCMIGIDMVNWLMEVGQRLVHNRQQAIGMWQGILEDGHIMHGTNSFDLLWAKGCSNLSNLAKIFVQILNQN